MISSGATRRLARRREAKYQLARLRRESSQPHAASSAGTLAQLIDMSNPQTFTQLLRDPSPLPTIPQEDGTTEDQAETDMAVKQSAELVKLNVGGQSFHVSLGTLAQPRNGWMAYFARSDHQLRLQRCDGFHEASGEYFFERSAHFFQPMFNFYITGNLHFPMDFCQDQIFDELHYWGVPTTSIAPCCVRSGWLLENGVGVGLMPRDEFEGLRWAAVRKRIWNVVEVSHQTGNTRIFEFLSMLFVLLSVIGLTLGSVPELQLRVNLTQTDGSVAEDRIEHPFIVYLEYVCVTWFTAEYLLRLAVSPRKCKFIVQALSMVDLVAIVPFYVELAFNQMDSDAEHSLASWRWAFLVVRLLRVSRVIRVIKLGRFSSGLQAFAMTLKRSQKQLQMMAIVLLTGVIFFSTLVYYVEKDVVGTPFRSIPATFWWCVVTMTTVGYGDMVPVTTAGKLVGSGAILMGVLVLALPITIIVDNFIKVSVDDEPAPSAYTTSNENAK